MPVKNGGRYLSSAIRSTLLALPRDAELVVADDGSTDNTQRIIEQYKDNRLRVLSWTASKGVSASLNHLLAQSDSQFVARMDADDICLPFRFRLQAATVADYDCIFSSVICVNEKGFPVRPQIPGRIGPIALPLHLLMGNVLVHPTMFAQRAFVESLGGYSSTPAEDYDLWLRGAAAGRKMMRSAIPTLLYRRHGAQVSASGGWLDEKWDRSLDVSYASLAAAVLNIQVFDNSLRRARSSGDGRLVSGTDNDAFETALAEAIKALPPFERLQARVRLRAMQRKALSSIIFEGKKS